MVEEEKKKKKHQPERPASRFLRKHMPRLYFASILLYFVYMIALIVIERIAQPDQQIYVVHTLWIMLLVGLGMLISSLLYLFIRLLRGFLMLVGGSIILLCVLTFLGPSVSQTQGSVANLHHSNHVYRIAPIFIGSSMPTLELLQCDSLGIICDRIETEGVYIQSFWGSPPDNQYQLEFDESQNAILWLQDGEVIYTHPLE